MQNLIIEQPYTFDHFSDKKMYTQMCVQYSNCILPFEGAQRMPDIRTPSV